MPKPLMTFPPPPRFESGAPPSTVTMRAITEEDGEIDESMDALPAEPFEVLFDRAVEAYLGKDYEAALGLFRDALRLQPSHEVCLHNVRRIEARIAANDAA